MNIVLCILAVGRSKVEHGKANLASYSCVANLACNSLMEKVHVGKACGAAFNHFSNSKLCAISNEFFA